ncbi:hypothetical protein NA57DRAFT_81092 [Rhizodiscina lignyota]|uniref:Heterokaryon incompatibility domain-containing protein n=1 Tax=Rhizodiscina lignyota TaxID=1504668 RepID=A0A9P4I254_9PEZI|nr:hypothetical protein NA57DRAFT_81092 [Rhizodiscina lignyota]
MLEGRELLITTAEGDFWRPDVPASDKSARWLRKRLLPLRSQLGNLTKRRNSDTDLSRYTSNKDLHQRLPDRRSIRLLRPLSISGTSRTVLAALKTVNLDTCGPYRALSYTWGPATDEADVTAESEAPPVRYQLAVIQETVLDLYLLHARISGTPVGEALLRHACLVPIEQNLSDFLVTYVEHGFNVGEEPIWIDAICINQKDESEKASQINLMGDIYSFASRVILWLGKGDQLRSTVFCEMTEVILPTLVRRKSEDENLEKYLDRFQDIEPTDSKFWSDLGFPSPSESGWQLIWQEYMKFIQHNRWFRRCWVGQEFCLAERIVVMCGSRVMEPSFMALTFSDRG